MIHVYSNYSNYSSLTPYRQLEAELQADIHRDHKNGTDGSPLYRKLPAEIRAHIFSYVVAADKSVHIFPPKGNETHGYRLSLCDESSYDFELGHCRCDDRRARASVNSNFFDNAIFLVSRSVRREALDAFFLINKFTFTCLYELVRFTSSFRASSSKIQQMRILERVDDYPNSDFRVRGIQKARQRLKALKHLDLYVFLSSWSAYETFHEDGLVNQLLHFALGPPPANPPNTTDSAQQTRKRKHSEIIDESSIEKDTSRSVKTEASSSKKDGVEIDSSNANKEEKTPGLTSSPTTSEVSLSSLPDATRAQHLDKIINAYTGRDLLSKPLDSLSSSSCTSQSPVANSDPVETPAPFPIPPLKSFTANVRLRNLQLSLRNRPDSAKAEYYNNLYTRLTNHLTDVFLDNGKKYRTIEDVPSLGAKPKLKVRDDEQALTGPEKRGILYLKD